MDKTLFFILGPLLVVAALALAAAGLRNKDFPSRGAMMGIVGAFTALVIAVMVFAVLNAQSESLGSENKKAAAELRAADAARAIQLADNPNGSTTGGQAPPGAGPPPSAQTKAPSGAGETLSVTSPADGSLKFEPATLQAKPGSVTIEYKNPSPVPHSIAIEGPDGKTINQTQPGAMATFKVSALVKAGKYIYYCTVPGHRQAGMQGTFTVK